VYKTIILLVVFYGCETWWLTLRKEDRLRPFENRVLRRIFGLRRDEWGKLNNEKLTEICSSSDMIRVVISRIMT
jgi:hypothetical protein